MAGATQVIDAGQVGPNKFKPAQCAGLTLTNLVAVTGAGSAGLNAHNNLVIGDGSESQMLSGGSLDDCVVAGGASIAIVNMLLGSGGTDIIIGGKYALNTYDGGTGSDVCYYRPNDTPPSGAQCETSISLP